MSGGGNGDSGGENWRKIGENGGAGKDQCSITERTVLNSPAPDVVRGLGKGDLLVVELETHPTNRVVAKTAAGEIAGAITSRRLADIIECLQNDFAYEAEVLSVAGGRVEIEIRPA